jgi:UDP-N-acetylglucosamine 4-epimerase
MDPVESHSPNLKLIPRHSPRYDQVRRELAESPKVWLVTGVAGFIGSTLLDQLLGLGQTVVGLDNFSTGFQSNIDDVLSRHHAARGRFRLIRGDIRDASTCRDACTGVDYVLHQAALGSVPRSIDDPGTSNAVNVDGTLNVFVAARDAGIRRVVYASSCAVYGDATELPLTEDCRFRPLSPYAATKAADEMYAAGFARSYGVSLTGLRYFNVFGRRQDPKGAYAAVIPQWIAALLRHESCRIFGDGETSRDFVHVTDVAQANILAAVANGPTTDSAVYNVASGETATLNELFGFVREAAATFAPEIADASVAYEGFRPGDIAKSSANIARARQALGFEPVYRIRDGLAEAIDWYIRTSPVPDESLSLREA